MDLKIKDVAELLNVSESTIRRWLSDGRIPAYRINQQYRFSRNEIEDWVIRHRQDEDEKKDRESSEKGSDTIDETPHTVGGNKQFNLYRAVHKGRVIADMPGKTKEDVIRTTMKHISADLNLDADVLTELLLDREQLQPTALNHGIGIPHTRDFLLSSHYNVVTVVFPSHPLQYGALDGQPVHTLFFLFACDDKSHLHLLAKIAHLTSQPATQAFLRSKPNKEALLAYIKDWESGTTK